MNQTKYDNLMTEAEKLWDEYIALSYEKRPYGFNKFLSRYHPEIVDELERLENQ